jgi:hypothetical protein
MRSPAMLLMVACAAAGQPSAPAPAARLTPLPHVTRLCPMPVDLPDLARVEPMPVDRTNTAVPMPVSRPGCWNPLFHPSGEAADPASRAP